MHDGHDMHERVADATEALVAFELAASYLPGFLEELNHHDGK